jgi:hypothetical protein
VAQAVLLVLAQLGHGQLGAVHDEERVVPEPSGTASGSRHHALADTLDGACFAAARERIDEREHAPEASPEAAFARGNPRDGIGERAERPEEGRVVLGVRRALVGEPSAADPRTAVEDVDLEPGVVSEGQHHGRARHGAGLLDGVLGERRPVFDDPRRVREHLGHAQQTDRQIGEQRAELFELSTVSRRNDQRLPEFDG